MIKAIIHYNDINDDFIRIDDILGILKYKYKNIDISYKKIKKKKLFITINGEKLDCNYSLDYYMQAVDNILNKDGIYD